MTTVKQIERDVLQQRMHTGLRQELIEIRRNVRHRLREKSPGEADIIGVSNENLCGHIHTSYGMKAMAENLYRMFGPTKVVLVLRHPLTFIPSVYSYSVKWGSAMAGFDNILRSGRIIPKLDYQALVETYTHLFGKDNVLVLPYELFREDRHRYLKMFSAFVGVSAYTVERDASSVVNPSFSIPATRLLNGVNHLEESLAVIMGREDNVRRLNKMTKRVLEHPNVQKIDTSFPRYVLTSEQSHRYPALSEQLIDENYRIWDGALAGYNYQFNRKPAMAGSAGA